MVPAPSTMMSSWLLWPNRLKTGIRRKNSEKSLEFMMMTTMDSFLERIWKGAQPISEKTSTTKRLTRWSPWLTWRERKKIRLIPKLLRPKPMELLLSHYSALLVMLLKCLGSNKRRALMLRISSLLWGLSNLFPPPKTRTELWWNQEYLFDR